MEDKYFFVIILLVAAHFVNLSRCEEFEDDKRENTNSQRRNHDKSSRKRFLEQFSEDGVNRRQSRVRIDEEGVHKSHHNSHTRGKHQRRQNHHETVLRVVEPSTSEKVPSLKPVNPPGPIIEEGEMMVDTVREDNSYNNYESTKKSYDKRPNIILIMTDDQDVELGSMEYMPETLKIFRDNGVEFRHGYVATPMCCPSRSSILTGLYVHNHNVYTNNDNCSSVQFREKHEKHTFGAHLWSSGYYTSYIGKYLNKYDGSHIPYGWDEWNGLLMNSKFYNYTVNVNGKKYRHGNNYNSDYYPDLIANDTLDFLTRVGNEERKRPFLLVASFPSPHGPEDSAPQFSNLFLNATPHHTPSYNHAPNTDKQWILRKTDKMTPMLKDFTNLLMAKRLQTLQSVDIAVKSIMDKLEATGFDENTYVFYTSDHGYHVGQFGLIKGKSMPYEFDIRVPFFLHGPSSQVKGGTKILEPVMNIDLAPTFLDLAGLKVPAEMDGRSIVPLLNRYGPNIKQEEMEAPFVWPDVFLIESSGRREMPSSNDPSSSMPKKDKKSREEKLKDFLSDNETVRMDNLCLLHPYPCLPRQKKYCRKDGDHDRLQFKKCRHSDFVDDKYFELSINDPLYQVISTNSTILDSKRCRCRFKRSTDLEESDADWEMERQKIDEEIELLKKRIDELRNRRRTMRRKFLVEINNATLPPPEYSSTHSRRRKGKFHNSERERRPTTEKAFSVDDFEPEEEEKVPSSSVSSTTSTTESTTTKPTSTKKPDDGLEEEDSDEDEEESSIEEDEEDEGDENYEDSSEEIETTTPFFSTTTTTTPTTTTTTPATTTTTTTTTTEKSRKPDLGLDFEDFEMESFFRHHKKQRNKNRHNNRNRQHHKHRGQSKGQHGQPPDEGDSDFGDIKEVSQVETIPEESQPCDCYDDPRWIRQREREERKRKKLLSKIRKKQKYMKRIENPDLRKQAETCGAEEKMNCFWHDSDHWKTAPLWNGGSFCFCMNSNNNTYSCLRSVNATHNYLYCQFVTGFKMYFDLKEDPFQLKNAIDTLPAAQEDWMLVQLFRLKKCKGRAECWGEIDENEQAIQSSIWEQIFARWPRKKKRGHRRKH